MGCNLRALRRLRTLDHSELDPTVPSAAFRCPVVCDGHISAEAACRQPLRGHALSDEDTLDGLGAGLAQALFLPQVSAPVCVDRDLDARPLWVLADLPSERVELREARGLEHRRLVLEENRLFGPQNGAALALGRGDASDRRALRRRIGDTPLDEAQLHPPIEPATERLTVIGHRHIRPVASRSQSLIGDSSGHERCLDGVCAGLRQPHLPRSRADRVDVNADLNCAQLGVSGQELCEPRDEGLAVGCERRRRELEEHGRRGIDGVTEHDGAVGRAPNTCPPARKVTAALRSTGAAVVAVARLTRACVLEVRDAVSVIVRVRNAVVVIEVVPVLGQPRVTVAVVSDKVQVVVGVRAAVLIPEAVLVLGQEGALVDRIGDEVFVRVARAGASRSGRWGGLRDLRRTADTAGVRLIARDLEALILAIGHAVGVPIVPLRCPLQPIEGAPRGGAIAAHKADTAAPHDVQVVPDAQARAGAGIGGCLLLVLERRVHRGRDAELAREREARPKPPADAQPGGELVVERQLLELGLRARPVPQVEGCIEAAAARQLEHKASTPRRLSLAHERRLVPEGQRCVTDQRDAHGHPQFVDQLDLERDRRVSDGRCGQEPIERERPTCLVHNHRHAHAEVHPRQEAERERQIGRPALKNDVRDARFRVQKHERPALERSHR